MNGQWGVICNSQVGMAEALCFQLGFPAQGIHRNTIIISYHAQYTGATALTPIPGDEWAETYRCTFNESKNALCVEEYCDLSTSLAIRCSTHEEIVNQESKLSYIKKCIFTVVLVRLQHFVLAISTD